MLAKTLSNVGIGAIAIAAVAPHVLKKQIQISNALLLLPIISNAPLLSYLANKKVTVKSIEKLVIEKPEFFLNFNAHFYDTLTTSINAIQLLKNIRAVSVNGEFVQIVDLPAYDKEMGKRAERIYSAGENLATIIVSDPAELYLNLRIEL